MPDPRARGRHSSARSHPRAAVILLSAGLLSAGSLCFALGYSVSPPGAQAAPLRSEVTAARPTGSPSRITPTVIAEVTRTPSGGPTAAARSLRAVRDLSAGDTLLYYPQPYGDGAPCTFISFESPSPKFARVDCGQGPVNVKVCDIASTTAYSRPSA